MSKACYVVIPTREGTGLVALYDGKVFRTEEQAGIYAIEIVRANNKFIEAIVLRFDTDETAPETVFGYSREGQTW